MRKKRSPAYPAIDLAEAMERVGKLYERSGREPVDREAVVTGLGYGSEHGSSLAALAAARKFGLLAKQGDLYNVTARAERILKPSSPEEHDNGLEQALRGPNLFSELCGAFHDRRPTDQELGSHLSERGFSATAIRNISRSFRRSVEFVADKGTAAGGEQSASLSMSRRSSETDPYRVLIFDDRIEVSGVLRDRRTVDRYIEKLAAVRDLLPPGPETND